MTIVVTAYQLRPVHQRFSATSTTIDWHTRYDGVEDGRETVRTRLRARGWLHVRPHASGLTSLTSPNSLINAEGESGGRRHLFKLTGSYMLPYADPVRHQLRLAVRAAITRTFTVPALHGKRDNQLRNA